jgi:hypothetical protein
MTGRILEERRRRLKPEHVEMLACVKDWSWETEDFSILVTANNWWKSLRICTLMFLKMMDLDLPMLALRQVHLLHLDLLVLES